MAPAPHKGTMLTTARDGQLGLCWRLLAAVLLAFVGLTSPAPSSARPTVEYSQPSQTGLEAALPHTLVAANLREASAAIGSVSVNTAPTPRKPPQSVAASSHPQQPVFHDYEATGPPIPALSTPI